MGIITAVSDLIGGTELLAAGCFTDIVSVPGVTVGMVVSVTPRTYPGSGIYWQGYVSAPDQVTVKVCSPIVSFVTASVYDIQVSDTSAAPNAQTAQITLTAAQINGMNAAPILWIPAQGPGTYIRITSWSMNIIFGGANFTGGGAFGPFYGPATPTTNSAATSAAATNLTAIGGANQTQGPATVSGLFPSASTLNAGVYLSNLTAPFAGGGTTTVTFFCVYYVLHGLQ